eukprot:scaffold6852_cov134-Isochrysis_galbana.AAC.4
MSCTPLLMDLVLNMLVSILASCLEGARAPGVSKMATTGRWSEAAEPVNSVGSSLTVLQCHGELYSWE